MQTLTPTITRAWLKRLTAIIEHCNFVVDWEEDVPNAIWRANRLSRTEAIILRDELLQLTVSEVEVA